MADPAFCDYEALRKAAEERSEEYFLPDKLFEHTEGSEKGRGTYANTRFKRQEDGSLICPQGKPMRLMCVQRFKDGHTVSRYEGTACCSCGGCRKPRWSSCWSV